MMSVHDQTEAASSGGRLWHVVRTAGSSQRRFQIRLRTSLVGPLSSIQSRRAK